jgi:hypothetical protein
VDTSSDRDPALSMARVFRRISIRAAILDSISGVIAVPISRKMLDILNERLKGWLMGGKVAVFVGDEQVSDWADLRDDMNAGPIVIYKGGPAPRFRVLDGAGEFYAWIRLFPNPEEWVHTDDQVMFPGLEFYA